MPVLAYILLYLLVFTYGIVIGSFLNVCIYRIPKKESVVWDNSHCMTCNHKLSWYDLFPLFSYIFLKGRCRYCGVKLSAQYPVIEAFNGILYIIVFMAHGVNLESVIYCLMASCLLVLSVIDWRTFEIPIGCNYFLAALGIIFCIIDRNNLLSHVIGFFCVSIFLILLFIVSGGAAIGGGDIKLMAVAGLILGWQNITLAFFVGCILGSVIHVIRMKVTKAEHVLAMGPYLSAGIYLMALFGDKCLSLYLGAIGV